MVRGPFAGRAGPPPPRRRDGRENLVAWHLHRRLVVALRRALQELLEFLVAHDAHSPANSAKSPRSRALARNSCAFEVPGWMPSAEQISSCVYPSTSCITNTIR